ncbi:MAG TPA: hypothetical protein PLV46_00560 [Reyranella sp.]|jgi:hypothetical protein|uniref:hypothetical protein n=1 Tax=Reyranella sp. TaxID=1929291 RepID=UPI00262E6071|nr:hypothetical protein [Reyranella sp.]HQT09927.1 hypothetical protein [Reyranella sp.]
MGFDMSGDKVFIDVVVRIEKANERGIIEVRKARPHRSCLAPIVVISHISESDVLQAPERAFYYAIGGIGRPIVYNHNTQVPEGLGRHRADRLPDIEMIVVVSDDYTHPRQRRLDHFYSLVERQIPLDLEVLSV